MAVNPLVRMKLSTAQLSSALGASFGTVRNWNATPHAFTRFHQGRDLEVGGVGRLDPAVILGYQHLISS